MSRVRGTGDPTPETVAETRARRRKPRVMSLNKKAVVAEPPKPRAHNHYIHHSAHPERMIVVAPQGSRDLHAAFLRLAITVNETGEPKSLSDIHSRD